MNDKTYEIQKVRMCIKTFFNMYGIMPGAQDMIEWLGDSYEKILPICMAELKAA